MKSSCSCSNPPISTQHSHFTKSHKHPNDVFFPWVETKVFLWDKGFCNGKGVNDSTEAHPDANAYLVFYTSKKQGKILYILYL